MKIALRCSALTAACLLTAFSAVRADNPLEISMQHMKKAYKELSSDLQSPQDSDKASCLALAATLKTEAANARDQVPNKADGLPPDQKAAMVTAYQKAMDDFSAAVDTLSGQIKAGQWDAARKSVESLRQAMIDGHKQFRKKED